MLTNLPNLITNKEEELILGTLCNVKAKTSAAPVSWAEVKDVPFISVTQSVCGSSLHFLSNPCICSVFSYGTDFLCVLILHL